MRSRASSGRRRAHRGYVLLTSMVLITLFSVMISSLFALSASVRKTTYRRGMDREALQLAQGGAEVAVASIRDDPTYAGVDAQALGAGSYSVSVTAPTGSVSRRILLAEATVHSSVGTQVRRVRAVVDDSTTPPVYFHALASKETLTVNGDVIVDSYPTAHLGHIRSNQNVVHDGGGSGQVDGNSSAAGTVLLNGTPTITGTVQSGAPTATFPPVTQDFLDRALVNGTTNGDVSENSGQRVQGKIIGNLQVRGPRGCEINGVVWVTGNVILRGPVSGTGTIVCEGTMDLETREFNLLSDPANLAFISLSSSTRAIRLDGNRRFKGLLYAPEGEINIQGNSWLYGGAIARRIGFGGTPQITRWSGFGTNPPPLPSIFLLSGYQEL